MLNQLPTRWLAAAILAGSAAAVAQEYTLGRHSVDNGGTFQSTGNGFSLAGTIGQPDTQRLNGNAFELTGGFWFELTPTDCNEDGIANLVDHAAFDACAGGPGTGVADGCACFDVDDNGTVDLLDFAEAQRRFQGP